MSILSGIWDGIRGWVEDLIDSATAWLGSALDALGGAWDNFTTKTLPDLWGSIQQNANKIVSALENAVGNVTNYVTNWITNEIEYSSHFNTYVTQNIVNTIGASKDWVMEQDAAIRSWTDNLVKLVDPSSFLKDPKGTVEAWFWARQLISQSSGAGSFRLGFEEGLAEEEPSESAR